VSEEQLLFEKIIRHERYASFRFRIRENLFQPFFRIIAQNIDRRMK
jgi:hypothetical protein